MARDTKHCVPSKFTLTSIYTFHKGLTIRVNTMTSVCYDTGFSALLTDSLSVVRVETMQEKRHGAILRYEHLSWGPDGTIRTKRARLR